ncbi:MAG: hypothetical protein ACYCW6_17715 [Candidatus Xenobia bacterium]
MKKIALALLILLLVRGPLPAAAPADKAEDVVHMLLAGKDDAVYEHDLSTARQHDTTKAAFKAIMQRVRKSLGKVTKVERLQHAQEPVGGVLGIPSPDVQSAEDKQHLNDVYDTLWRIHSGTNSTWLLLTFVAENHQPRILWMEFIGETVRTPAFEAVEKQVRPTAESFMARLRQDQREALIDSMISSGFNKKMPRDHMMQLLQQVRYKVGVVGGVHYVGGWVNQDPPSVVVVFKQAPDPGVKDPYTVLVRLVSEGGQYKVDNLADLGHGMQK